MDDQKKSYFRSSVGKYTFSLLEVLFSLPGSTFSTSQRPKKWAGGSTIWNSIEKSMPTRPPTTIEKGDEKWSPFCIIKKNLDS